ncbi:MAG UNVERIFIED_CONTAM: hypothetical protein LVR29_20360 [Microcystis novacekii LVE1205-3]
MRALATAYRSAEIATLVNNYRREIKKNATDQGVWQDTTTFLSLLVKVRKES